MTTLVPGVQRLPVVRGLPSPKPPRVWTSMETGKFWSLRHRFRVLAVDHDAGVAVGPAGAAGALFADEAVFDAQPVALERLVEEDVAEVAVELVVAVEAHLEQAVLDAEGVLVVVAEFEAGDLRRPAGEVLAVEERGPLFPGGGGEREQDGGEQKRGVSWWVRIRVKESQVSSFQFQGEATLPGMGERDHGEQPVGRSMEQPGPGNHDRAGVPTGHPMGGNDFGTQRLDGIMRQWSLENGDLVSASTEQLTFKQAQKGRKGRRLTLRVMQKVARALNVAIWTRLPDDKKEPFIEYQHADLFSYAKGFRDGWSDPNVAILCNLPPPHFGGAPQQGFGTRDAHGHTPA